MPLSDDLQDKTIFFNSVRSVDWICAATGRNLVPGGLLRGYGPEKVVIGSASRNFTLGERHHYCVENCADGVSLIIPSPDCDFPARRRRLIEDIEAVLQERDQHANAAGAIVCFGELDYPVEFLDDGNLSSGEQSFRAELVKISTERNCLILAGTYHDRRDRCNKALLFSPGHTEPIEHAKLRPAHKLRERVRTPMNNQLRYYKTPFGNVAVLVCMDVYDLNVILGLARETLKSNELGPIEYILVPAYNDGRSGDAADACKRLSYLTNSTVVYVNCARNMPYNGIFVCGRELLGDERDSNGLSLWTTLRGSVDDPLRVTVLDMGFKETTEVETPKTYSDLMKMIILGERSLR